VIVVGADPDNAKSGVHLALTGKIAEGVTRNSTETDTIKTARKSPRIEIALSRPSYSDNFRITISATIGIVALVVRFLQNVATTIWIVCYFSSFRWMEREISSRKFWKAGLEMFIVGAIAATILYIIGTVILFV
jgi:hypothetical protein